MGSRSGEWERSASQVKASYRDVRVNAVVPSGSSISDINDATALP